MTRGSRFDAPRALSRALGEIARRAGGDHEAEAVLRAALPAAMGAWLHRRLHDVRIDGGIAVLAMAGETGTREAKALLPEIAREIRRRLGPLAPSSIRVERAPGIDAPADAGVRLESRLGDRPLVAEALEEVADPRIRARLAKWAGVTLDP
jgi:hypothetical protein